MSYRVLQTLERRGHKVGSAGHIELARTLVELQEIEEIARQHALKGALLVLGGDREAGRVALERALAENDYLRREYEPFLERARG